MFLRRNRTLCSSTRYQYDWIAIPKCSQWFSWCDGTIYFIYVRGSTSRRWVSLFRAALRSAGSSFIVSTPVNARQRCRAGVAPSLSQPRRCSSFGPRWRRDALSRCEEGDTEKEIENSRHPTRVFYECRVKQPRSRWQVVMIYHRGVPVGKRRVRTVFGHDLWNPSGQNFSALTTRRGTSCFVSCKCRKLEWSNKNGERNRVREPSSCERKVRNGNKNQCEMSMWYLRLIFISEETQLSSLRRKKFRTHNLSMKQICM